MDEGLLWLGDPSEASAARRSVSRGPSPLCAAMEVRACNKDEAPRANGLEMSYDQHLLASPKGMDLIRGFNRCHYEVPIRNPMSIFKKALLSRIPPAAQIMVSWAVPEICVRSCT